MKRLFTVTDIGGNYHAFDAMRVSTITTYRVGNTNEWRCEVHVGIHDPEQGNQEQLFLIRQNSQEEAVKIARDINSARDDAWKLHWERMCPTLVWVKDTGIDPSGIVYLNMNAHVGENLEEDSWNINIGVDYGRDFNRSYSVNMTSRLEMEEVFDRLKTAQLRAAEIGVNRVAQQVPLHSILNSLTANTSEKIKN